VITIAKHFTFDAAHCLPLMPEGHKCRRMHGHTYRAEIALSGVPDPATGILIDFDDIAKIWLPLHVALDHQVLNDVPGLSCPTTEVLVAWCIERLRRSFRAHANIVALRVRVSESSSTWAEAGVPL
jgi:6-pyruvoyltetrahydropterin/6-carboxytetrahydropterin synthase